MTHFLITGAAGYIGSTLVEETLKEGHRVTALDRFFFGEDVLRDLAKSNRLSRVKKDIRDAEIADFNEVDVVVDLAALSNDPAGDLDPKLTWEVSCLATMRLADEAKRQGVRRFIYASSAAVYGGSSTFREERSFESPLNVYGYSKFLFDQVVRRRAGEATAQVAGFRYFNVYGPQESHKGRMASVAWHFYNQYRATGKVRPFAGSGGYGDGEQRRDFVSVDDVVSVNLWFLDHPEVSGIFNVGTGKARSFADLAKAVFRASNREPQIVYVDMPEAMRSRISSTIQPASWPSVAAW